MARLTQFLRENWLPLACFLIGLIIAWGQLSYPAHWLSEWDESQYINSGRALAHGRLPILALNPFLSIFYLPLFEVFKHQPMWLFYAATWGHRILYVGLWGTLFLVGKELFGPKDRVALAVWPIVTAGFAALVANSSDATFAIFSGLAFWQLLKFRNEPKLRFVTGIGIFIGLSILCRTDGFFLAMFVAAALVGLLYNRAKLEWLFPVSAAFLLPLVCLITLDLMFQKRTTGEWQLGIKPRTYIAFEQGQGVAYPERFKGQNPMSAGLKWSNQLYGSMAKNDESIVRAVAHNPNAFFRRVTRQVSEIPDNAIAAFSDANRDPEGSLPVTGLALLLMAAVGAIYLNRIKQPGLIAICLLWSCTLFVYVITFYRPGCFLAACFPLFVLAAFGLVAIIRAVENMFPKGSLAPAAVAFPAIILGMVAGWSRGIPTPVTYQVTETDLLSAVAAIQHAVPANYGVVSSAPQLAFLAQKPWVDPTNAPNDPNHFKHWAKENKAQAMVLDGRLQYDNPNLYTTLAKVAPRLGKQVEPHSDNFKVFKLSADKVVAAKTAERKKEHRRKVRRGRSHHKG